MPLFGTKTKSPQELVKSLKENLVQLPTLKEKEYKKVSEEISKTLQSIKTILYGTVDQEPATEQVAMLSTEMYQSNTLPLLIQNLARVDFEGRKDVVAIFNNLLRRQIGTRTPTEEYICTNPIVLIELVKGLSSSEKAPKIRSGGSLFSRGSKFRFSGRCQNEAYEASENIHRSEPPFARTSSLPNFGKKSHGHEKKNTLIRDSRTTESFREVYLAPGKNKEEAAIDVPSSLVYGESPAVTPTKEEVIETGPQVKAPLASVETFEEKIQKSVSAPVTSAIPPVFKENGQVVKDRPAVLETSIDETIPYEPNSTVIEDSDEDKSGPKPDLDEQIKMLEEELINPIFQKDLNLSPEVAQSLEVKPTKKETAVKQSSSGVCLKAVLISIVVMLLLSMVLFYVVFFSPIKHPFISKMRHSLQFLEPVRDVLIHKTNQVLTYFKK